MGLPGWRFAGQFWLSASAGAAAGRVVVAVVEGAARIALISGIPRAGAFPSPAVASALFAVGQNWSLGWRPRMMLRAEREAVPEVWAERD